MSRAMVVLFWAALIFAFVMAILPRPPRLTGDLSDKVQHILAFAVLTALALAAYRTAMPIKIAIWLASFGAAIELIQLVPMLGRDGAWLDWVADCGAVVVVLLIGVPLRTAILRRT